MSELTLPEEILRIIWRYVYSDYVVPRISYHARVINKYLPSNNNLSMAYAVNYNVLRIMSGMAVLHYSS
jgi:hypothetical protein